MPFKSLLQQARMQYQPKVPKALENIKSLSFIKTKVKASAPSNPQVAVLFPLTHHAPFLECTQDPFQTHLPLKVGVVLSGGQAPGGHNVISGLFDALKAMNPQSTLIGFLNGPNGIVEDHTLEISDAMLADYRNQGGFDLIGSGRTKIESKIQFEKALSVVTKHGLDGLIVIGGDDSNTNAAFLAEYFASNNCKTSVIGVPKTIDGDLKGESIEISFGFDSASKHYSETIGSLMQDALSAKKYYYFIKLMGRSASHITLECALQTHPNLALISEEVAARKQSLKELVAEICDVVCRRSEKGKDYGVILIPEGVVEFIPEFKRLIEELNRLLATTGPHSHLFEKLNSDKEKIGSIEKLLSKECLACFQTLPKEIQSQLLIGRDSHGNVQVSKIETERLLIELVIQELQGRFKKGLYKGAVNLKTAVQDNKVMQDFELESFSMGGDHSQKVKAAPIERDYGSKDCVNLWSSTAVFRFSPMPHFCGYEGRSCLPSNFDSDYCYSLGRTAALLIYSKANGYIALLKNLSKSSEGWLPGCMPLTRLMTMEERQGKAKPVIQKALVDLKGRPFTEFSRLRSDWIEEDSYSNPGPIQFFGPSAITDRISRTLELELFY